MGELGIWKIKGGRSDCHGVVLQDLRAVVHDDHPGGGGGQIADGHGHSRCQGRCLWSLCWRCSWPCAVHGVGCCGWSNNCHKNICSHSHTDWRCGLHPLCLECFGDESRVIRILARDQRRIIHSATRYLSTMI